MGDLIAGCVELVVELFGYGSDLVWGNEEKSDRGELPQPVEPFRDIRYEERPEA